MLFHVVGENNQLLVEGRTPWLRNLKIKSNRKKNGWYHRINRALVMWQALVFSIRPRHQSKDLSFPERDKLWIRAAFAISANEDEFHIGDDPIAKAFLLFAFHLGAQIRRFVIEELRLRPIGQRVFHIHVLAHEGTKLGHLWHAFDAQCVNFVDQRLLKGIELPLVA